MQVLTWKIPIRYTEKKFTSREVKFKFRMEFSSPEMWEAMHPWTGSEFEQNPKLLHLINQLINSKIFM